MIAVFIRTIKDKLTSFIIYLVASLGFLWLYMGIYPTIQAQSANLESLLKFYPESMFKAFNIDINTYTTIGGYLSAEMFSFVWPLMAIFMAVGLSGALISGEIEKGTMELLLAQPISRLKLFWGKYLAGLANILVFVALSTLTIPLFLKGYHISYDIKNFYSIAILSGLFTWAVYSIAMLCSSIFSDKGKVFFITGGLLVLMYVANVAASLKTNLDHLKYFSFFYYFNASKALIYHDIYYWSYWVFGGVIVLSVLCAAIIFNKRNITA